MKPSERFLELFNDFYKEPLTIYQTFSKQERLKDYAIKALLNYLDEIIPKLEKKIDRYNENKSNPN